MLEQVSHVWVSISSPVAVVAEYKITHTVLDELNTDLFRGKYVRSEVFLGSIPLLSLDAYRPNAAASA